MNLCVIPARGGSKRIPRKNIKVFLGIPMIAHAIEVAIASGLFEHIVVSTDDNEIAKIAVKHGAKVPFMREKDLADDHTPTAPVIAHAILECTRYGWSIDKVCCIYPCVPLLHTEDLKACLDLLEKSQAPYSFPVTEFPSAIQRALKRDKNYKLTPFYPENALSRSQDLETAYYDAGQFYWGTKNAWLSNAHAHSNGVGLAIPRWRVVDIDTPEDWQQAERLVKANSRA